MLVLAAVSEELGDLPGETVGIGPVVAAANAAALLVKHRPDAVLMVGTCGVYPNRSYPIGSAIISTEVGLSYGVAAMGMGYVPRAPKPVSCRTWPALEDVLRTAKILTTGAITTDETLAGRLSDQWDVEHLEAFGVAYACQQMDIPFTCILGIANDVGPNAHVQWLTHREDAQNAARNAAKALLG